MKPKPDQDVPRQRAVKPLYSSALPISVLSTPPKEEQFKFNEEDRKSVEEVLKHEAAAADDESG